jgi:hypothetical protein
MKNKIKNLTASQELGKKVFFGKLTKIDLLIETKILVKAGLNYYKNCEDEYLTCEQSNKGWFEICTQNMLLEYINQLKNKIKKHERII